MAQENAVPFGSLYQTIKFGILTSDSGSRHGTKIDQVDSTASSSNEINESLYGILRKVRLS